MRILYFGNGLRGARCLEALLEAGREVAGVIVHHGQGAPPGEGSVAAMARAAGLPLLEPRNVNDSRFIEEAMSLRPDLGIMSGYGRILRKEMLSIPPRGIINLHGGPLPGYRGASVINWQIINGESTGACTILHADEGIDTGDILAAETYPIGPDETAGDVISRTLEIFPGLLLEVLEKMERGVLRRIPQNSREGRYWRKRHPGDGEIDWASLSDREVHNLVRALNGHNLPGAFTFLGDEKVVIHGTKILEDTIQGPPGGITEKRPVGLVVACRNRGILVTHLERSEKMLLAGDEDQLVGEVFQ